MVRPVLGLDRIGVFLTVVEAGSFSAAARKLNRAQSAVTCAVQKLEADPGVQLFNDPGTGELAGGATGRTGSGAAPR